MKISDLSRYKNTKHFEEKLKYYCEYWNITEDYALIELEQYEQVSTKGRYWDEDHS